MPSPYSGSSTTPVTLPSGRTEIDALATDVRWGTAVDTTTYISYSFPWKNGGYAYFDTDYSDASEQYSGYAFNTIHQSAATSAMAQWASVANIRFTEIAETSTNVGQIRLAWTSDSDIQEAWGWGYYPSSYYPVAGDIWINSEYYYDSWDLGSYNFLSLLHEFGHALGLKHPHAGDTVMPSQFDNDLFTVMSYEHAFDEIYPETLMVLDILATQYMYGANYSYKSGNDTYTFDTGRAFLKTIWDGGGTDTIDLEGYYGNTQIDLTPGAYSKLAPDGSKQFGIAYNCTIENVIGGRGNDIILGNSANNYLDGGDGSDTLRGGAGNDYFDWDASYRGGNDYFYGGAGNDVYVLWENDSVIEYANEGTDLIWVTSSYSLESLANVENLGAFGTSSITLTGNSLANVLIGSSGDDTLDGKDGIDTAQFTDAYADCSIVKTTFGYSVVTKSFGTDQLNNIEYASFADKKILLSTIDGSSSGGSSSGGSSSGGSSSGGGWSWVAVGNVLVEQQDTSLYISSGGTLYFLADSGFEQGASNVDPFIFRKANGKTFVFKSSPTNFHEHDGMISVFSKNVKNKWTEIFFDSETGRLTTAQIKHTASTLLSAESSYEFDIDKNGKIGTASSEKLSLSALMLSEDAGRDTTLLIAEPDSAPEKLSIELVGQDSLQQSFL